MENEKVYIGQCDKIINKMILRGKKFVDYGCFSYGSLNYMISGEVDSRFIDDFQYFVFTKSTKSLVSIRTLAKIGHFEDVFILLRSMFEGYLASRFIDEKFDMSLLNDFLFIPHFLAQRKVIYECKNNLVKDREGNVFPYVQRNPSKLELGKDKGYMYDLYDILCNYAHCNYAIHNCYVDDQGIFSCDSRNDELLVKVLTTFVYIRLFECVVTVEGEDFLNANEEKQCYNLVKETNVWLDIVLEMLGNQTWDDENNYLNKYMKRLFKNMRKALLEELGSVDKSFLR